MKKILFKILLLASMFLGMFLVTGDMAMAATESNLQTGASSGPGGSCPKTIGAVLGNSVMQGFDLGRIFQCRPGESASSIIQLVSAIFNILVFPLLLVFATWRLFVSNGAKSANSVGGGGYGGYGGGGGGQGGGFVEGLKTQMAEKSSELVQLFLVFGFWMLGLIDIFVFIIRVALNALQNDADSVVSI